MTLRQALRWWLAPSYARPERRHEKLPARFVTVVIEVDVSGLTRAMNEAGALLGRMAERAIELAEARRARALDHQAATYGDGWPT